MPLQKIVLKPGINRESTNYANEGGYYSCDKVRFRSGYPEKIGGWTLYSAATFWGVCRAILPFQCQCGATLVGLGTNLKFYAEFGAQYYDITPIADTNALTNAFTTDTATPTIIVVNDPGYSPGMGDFVTISGVAAPINGVPITEINGERRVTVLSTTTYSFPITTAPTSSGTTGSCTAEYQLYTGGAAYTLGTGWDAGTWGRSTWGSGTSVGIGQQLRLWSVDNYGDALVFGPRGGGLYYWTYAAGVGLTTRGVLISSIAGAASVPLSQNYIIVSDQSRFVITLGSNDFGSVDANPMLVRWSDQENYLEWTPTATTQAGSQLLSVGSTLITALQTRQEILVWSDSALFSMQYSGPPYIFGFTTLADNISIIGPNAAIVVNNVAYWMGTEKFFVYDGRVQTLVSTVRAYVFNDMSLTQGWQVFAGAIEEFSEIWWFYCSTNATTVDRYVAYNYVDNLWVYGTMSRPAWVDSGLKPYPTAAVYNAATELGTLYSQEFGTDDATTAPSTAINSYVESSDFDIGDGDNFGLITRIIPDITFAGSPATAPAVTMTVTPRRFPGSAYGTADSGAVTRSASVPVEQFTEQLFVRVRGRQLAFKVESTAVGVAWQLGMPRIQVRPDGRK